MRQALHDHGPRGLARAVGAAQSLPFVRLAHRLLLAAPLSHETLSAPHFADALIAGLEARHGLMALLEQVQDAESAWSGALYLLLAGVFA